MSKIHLCCIFKNLCSKIQEKKTTIIESNTLTEKLGTEHEYIYALHKRNVAKHNRECSKILILEP